eukprot:3251076-Prymnesium_polylepis.1
MASAIYVCTTKTHLEGAILIFKVAILLTLDACTMSPRSRGKRTTTQRNHGCSKATPLAHTDRL